MTSGGLNSLFINIWGISLIQIMSAVQILHFYHMVPRQMSVQKSKYIRDISGIYEPVLQ